MLKTYCTREGSTSATKQSGSGVIGLARSSQARSRSAGPVASSPVIGNGVKIIDLVSKLLLTQFCDIAFVMHVLRKINYRDGV